MRLSRTIRVLLFAVLVLPFAAPAFAQTTYFAALPNAVIQFFDDDGLPLSGGLVYTYLAGTVTPQATFTDSTGASQNPNPVVLDAAGRAAIWLASTNPYKLVAQTSTGTQVWTKDNVSDFGAILKRDLQTSFVTKSLDSEKLASQYAGANACAQYAAAMADAASSGGYVSGIGIQGAQTCSADPFTGITKPITLELGPGTTTLSANITVPANVTLRFSQGAILSPNTGKTLTINGHIEAPMGQIFAGAGTVTIAPGASDGIHPEWWGAIADGTTDNAAALQSAINASSGNANPYSNLIGPDGGGWSTVLFASGTYLFKTGITLAHSGVHFRGAGYSSTILRFQPASGPATAITFNASEELHDASIEDLTLDATGSSLSVVKLGLYLYDVAEVSLRNFYVRDFSDTTHASQCVELHGREHINVDNAQWFCNRPLVIGADPETATEGLDRSTFHNVLFGALTSVAESNACVTDKPVIDISEADALLADVKFDGFDFLCGSYSVYWSNTNAKVGSYDVSFHNGRNESHGTLPEWAFYIHPPSGNPVTNLTFDAMTLHAGDKGGWYLRNVVNGSLNSVAYAASASIAPVDADATAGMSFANVNWNLHSAMNNALNGWCGTRWNEDGAASVKGNGNFVLRACSDPDIVLETFPAGTTYSVSAATCTGSLATYTIGTNTMGANGQITVTGLSPSGLNGTYSVVSATGTTVTVVNDACPLTYSSGGTNAMVYGPPSFISTAPILSGASQGDLQLRSDGTAIWLGSKGTGQVQMPATTGGLLLSSGGSTPIGGAGTVGIGVSVEDAGTGACPATVTIAAGATAPYKCLVLTIGGTSMSVPGFH